ncbi:MAG: hypothetical protein CM1200mP18_17390 [Gammaproteobacteria bacterium]|nr:MAG: hypothetical protein CM1200mP18_17390 [Gammaproteobacteria bacterium]
MQRGLYLGMDTEIISPKEAADIFPLLDPDKFVGAMSDPLEGHLDPSGQRGPTPRPLARMVPSSTNRRG